MSSPINNPAYAKQFTLDHCTMRHPVIRFSILAADESDNEDSGIGLSPQPNGHDHRRGSHIQINTSQYD